MSHLEHIQTKVRENGSYEESWLTLVNAYFRGADCFEQIKAWATKAGLDVSFNERNKTCLFRPTQDQSRADAPE